MTHIVAFDIEDFLAVRMNLTSEVVLSLLLNIADFVKPVKVVLGVSEFDLACQLMAKSSDEQVVKLVPLIVPCDLGAVGEFNSLVTVHVQSA